jgi:tetratricopeptide (TPR) repeat protein
VVSSTFQFTNVPTGVWIDERGRVVRPGEPAWTTSRTTMYGGKPLTTEGAEYVAGVRDWVANGDRSVFALSDDAFAARVKARSPNEMDADAHFALAVWLYQGGNATLAKTHFEQAQALNPDDWNYHRQDWSFTPGEAGPKWMEKFQKLDAPYYPKLDLKPADKPKG